MMHLYCAGELVRDPESKVAKNGNRFASALLRVDRAQEGPEWIAATRGPCQREEILQ
jgi:hypothetical protein